MKTLFLVILYQIAIIKVIHGIKNCAKEYYNQGQAYCIQCTVDSVKKYYLYKGECYESCDVINQHRPSNLRLVTNSSNPLNQTCQICNENEMPNCVFCDSMNNYNNCTKCIKNKEELNQYYYLIQEQVKKIGSCKMCSPKCRECNQHEEFCISCHDGYQLMSNQCQRDYSQNRQLLSTCNESCYNCSKSEPNKCYYCNYAYYLQKNQLSQQFGKCIKECSSHQYKDENLRQCIECSENCLTCNFNSNYCTSCNNGQLNSITGNTQALSICIFPCLDGQFYNQINQQCQQCDSNCYQCNSQNQCQICKYNYYLINDSGKTNCAYQCPERFYVDNVNCLRCDNSCRSCYERTNQDCKDCANNYVKHLNSTCLSQCPDGFQKQLIKNESYICKKCNEIQQMYYDQQQKICKRCHYSCQQCDGETQLDCILCSENRGNSNNYPQSGVCLCQYQYIEDIKQHQCLEKDQSIKTIENSIEILAANSVATAAFSTLITHSGSSLLQVMRVLQSISFVQYMNINYPNNIDGMLKSLYWTNLNFFHSQPKQSYEQQQSKNQRRNLQEYQEQYNQTIDYADKFLLNGKGKEFFENTYFIIILHGIAWGIILILRIISQYLENNSSIKKQIEKLRNSFDLDLPLQIFMATSLEMNLLLCLQMIKYGINNIIDAVMFSTIIFYITLIIFVSIINIKMKSQIQQQQQQSQDQQAKLIYIERFKVLWEDLRLNRGLSKYFYLILMAIKFIECFCQVNLYTNVQDQALLVFIIELLLLLIIIILRPFENSNFINIISQILLVIMYMLIYVLAFYVDDHQTSQTIGWLILITMFLIVLFNIIILFGTMVIQIVNLVKNYQKKRKGATQKVENESNNDQQYINNDIDYIKNNQKQQTSALTQIVPLKNDQNGNNNMNESTIYQKINNSTNENNQDAQLSLLMENKSDLEKIKEPTCINGEKYTNLTNEYKLDHQQDNNNLKINYEDLIVDNDNQIKKSKKIRIIKDDIFAKNTAKPFGLTKYDNN